jgi:hypothetical protein
MFTRRVHRMALAILAASACGSPSSSPEAGEAIRAHLHAIAPHAIVADSFEVIDAAVEGGRAHFRTVWAFTDTSGMWVDTSRVLTAKVKRVAEDWVVAGYDNALTDHVLELVDEDRRRRYQDLLDAVHHVYHAILDAGWYYAPRIDANALRERVESTGHGAHAPWGITEPAPLVAQVIWLQDPNDPGAACALPVTAGEGRPQGFEWVRDPTWFTCRGRGEGLYSRATLPDEVRAMVRASGVMPAAPPASAPEHAAHEHGS